MIYNVINTVGIDVVNYFAQVSGLHIETVKMTINRDNIKMKTTLKLASLLAAMATGSLAQAASVSYYLDQSNVLDDGVNYLQVTISDSLTITGDIDFSVAVLTDAFSITGSTNFGMQNFSFNFDNTLPVTSANIINIDPSSWTISENMNAGGNFGKFEFQLDGSGATRTELLSFSITGVEGDTLSSYALGSTLNPSSGEFFAAHVAGFDETNGVTSAQFAGSTPVPLPAAFVLFGSGLVALAGLVRRRKLVL